MNRQKYVLIAVLMVCGLFMVIGCGGGGSADGPSGDIGGQEQELVPITVSVSSGLDHTPVFVGIEKGIFNKYGLDVKTKMMSTGIEIVAAQQSGDTQFAPVGIPAYSIAQNENVPLKVLAIGIGLAHQPKSDSDLAVVAHKDSGIKTLADLRGKRIAVATGTGLHEYIVAVLKDNDISLDEVELINIAPTEKITALERQDVDAMVNWEPLTSQALLRVEGSYVVVEGGDYIARQTFIATSPDYLEKNPEICKKYLTALVEAYHYTRTHREEAAAIATRWLPGLEADIARAAMEKVPLDPRISKASMEGAANSVAFLVDIGRFEEPVDVSPSIEPSLIYEIMQEHPEFFEDLQPIPEEYLMQ